ncbi:hypothetical protein GCM10009639_09380 [Kitasatospora putterlickiae]|uniref:Uncharacterized protein n=1 Tax=Kitasatospora putterlickiae TaxID=221725 RepID=A0ABN1XNZ3_9ACTN
MWSSAGLRARADEQQREHRAVLVARAGPRSVSSSTASTCFSHRRNRATPARDGRSPGATECAAGACRPSSGHRSDGWLRRAAPADSIQRRRIRALVRAGLPTTPIWARTMHDHDTPLAYNAVKAFLRRVARM